MFHTQSLIQIESKINSDNGENPTVKLKILFTFLDQSVEYSIFMDREKFEQRRRLNSQTQSSC